MAKVVKDDNNKFRHTWSRAREQGVGREVMADSLGISRGRLNDLILGRKRPTLGEAAALTSGRRATLVRYHDVGGGRHGFYTGSGMSFERLIEEGVIEEMMEEQADANNYLEPGALAELTNRYPKRPQLTNIYSIRKRRGDTTRDMRVKR